MVVKIDLKTLISKWFDLKTKDDTNRPAWINTRLGNYKNGYWGVGEK